MSNLKELIAQVPPGELRRGQIELNLTPTTTLPYLILRGKEPGPTLLVTAGIHGAEYASIAAAYRLADLNLAILTGTLAVLPIVNPTAFFQRSIYVNPVDGKNLNRVFPGDPQGSYAETLAYALTEGFFRHADALIDLHGGDLVEGLLPFSIYSSGHAASRLLALACGLPHVVASESRGMTYEMTRLTGCPAIIAEAGGQGLWPAAAVDLLVTGVERAMRHLGMWPGEISATPAPEEHRTFAWLRATRTGLWYPLAAAGTTVEKGQAVGEIRDLTGILQERFTAPQSGVVLFHVSSLAINEGDPLLGIGG